MRVMSTGINFRVKDSVDPNSYIMTDYGSYRLPADVAREYELSPQKKHFTALDLRFKRARLLYRWEHILHQRISDYFRANPDAPNGDVHKVDAPTLAEAAAQ